ncbi:MAG: PEP-CTERM sorting domain-containing protein [Akkermansiaceae bacterium]
MHKTKTSFAALAFLAGIQPASAVVLIDWDFSSLDWRAGQGSGLALNDPAPDPILDSSFANAVPGLSASDLTPSAGLNVVINATTAAGEADVRDFDFGGNGTNENYLEFTVTADVPGTLTVDSLSISQWRNGAGAVDGVAFEVSVDGGAFSLYDSIQVDSDFGGGPDFETFTFNETISGADSVVVRYAPRNVTQGSTGNLHINNIQVNGSVIPEPSTLGLSALACLAVAFRRRK